MINLIMSKFILSTLFLWSIICSSYAAKAEFSSYMQVGNNPLIVVHANPLFNRYELGSESLNELIKNKKDSGAEVFFLYSNRSSKKGISGWYTQDKEPTKAIFSFQGENNFINQSAEFSIAGGYLGSDGGFGCMTATLIDLTLNHFTAAFNLVPGDIKLNIHLGSSYTYGNLGWNRSLKQMFQLNERADFLTFLMTAQPSMKLPMKHAPLNGVIQMEHLINDENAYPDGFLDFGNVFYRIGHNDWAMAGVRTNFNGEPRKVLSTKEGYSFHIQFKNEPIGVLGSGNKEVILNFL
jgi:hypothetical protein